MRWGENRRKAKRLMDQDNNSLIRKTKAVCSSKAKRESQWLLPISRQMSSQCLQSRALAHVMVAWEDKHHNPKCALPPLFPELLLLSMMLHGIQYPFGQFGSAVSAVSPRILLHTPSLLAFGWRGREITLTLCEHCSAIAETLVCYPHCYPHKCKTQHHRRCYEVTF